MSTPTPSQPAHPGSASKKPTGHVTTPAHFGLSSPAPRSVPSPTATRKEQAGKTPINHPTTGSSGSKTLGGTPMIHSLSQQGGQTSSSSPGLNLLSFGTPIGLGVEGITPSQLNMHTPALGGVPMSLTMSDLGMSSSGAPTKRNDDEERRARLRKVLKKIGKPKGRVSEEGITLVGRRVGFDNGLEGSPGNRQISIAGKQLLVDVVLREQRPPSVSVSFLMENAGLDRQKVAIGEVLMADLHKAGESPLEARLDAFAANLERLASMDRLSSDNFSTFEAIGGVYSSLQRLHDQEVAAVGALQALKKRSGKPGAHEDGEIGMHLTYWQARCGGEDEPDKEHHASTFKLHLGVERSAAGLYPSLRVSDAWLPDPLELPAADSGEPIPWQDPPPTFITAPSNGDAMAVDGDQKLPDLRFIARLEPPLVLPWQTAVNVLQLVGMPAPQVFVMPPAWHALLLDPSVRVPVSGPEEQAMTAEKSVLSMAGGEEGATSHTYSLDVPKPDAGYVLSELPFSHPRQLVELLPTLRQWVCFGTMVKDIFTSPSSAGASPPGIATRQLSLSDLLTPPSTPPFADKLPVNVSLATSPTPTMSFSFPTKAGQSVRNVTIQMLQNGDLSVHEAGITGDGDQQDDDTDDHSQQNAKLAKALDVCGDVGVWVQWLRSRNR